MIQRFTCVIIAAAAVLGTTATARAIPEPSDTPETWELTIRTTPPERIQVGGKSYWYILYTVTNNTGQDIDFHPSIVRVNEIDSEMTAEMAEAQPDAAPTITVDAAIVGPRPEIFRAIKTRHAKTHPFLVSPVEAITRLLQGDDNAITSVAIFKDLDRRVSRFTVFITGLSGERQMIPNPAYKPDSKGDSAASDGARRSDNDGEDNPRYFVLQKTLALPYTLPGDPKTRRSAEANLGRIKWVMR